MERKSFSINYKGNICQAVRAGIKRTGYMFIFKSTKTEANYSTNTMENSLNCDSFDFYVEHDFLSSRNHKNHVNHKNQSSDKR
jgi:hypothetical protein